MVLNGGVALILRHFTEFCSFGAHCIKVVKDVVVKTLHTLSHLLISFLSYFAIIRGTDKVLYLHKTTKQKHRCK